MSLDAFKIEFLESTEPWSDEPTISHQRLWGGTVHLDVLINTFADYDKVALNFIATYFPDRGKGYASDCLRWLVSLGDRHDVSISLWCEPIGSTGLSKVGLRRWYRRYGFQFDRHWNGFRTPAKSVGRAQSNEET